MILLDTKFLRQKFSMLGGTLPVDEAVIKPRHMIAQGFEFRADPLVLLDLDAADGFPAEELQGRALDAAYVGQDIDLAVQRLAYHAFREPHRALPAQPHRIGIDHAPATWMQSKRHVGATID